MEALYNAYEGVAANFEPSIALNETIHTILYTLAKSHLSTLAHLVGKNYTLKLASGPDQETERVELPPIIQGAIEQAVAHPYTTLLAYIIVVLLSLYATFNVMHFFALRDHRAWLRQQAAEHDDEMHAIRTGEVSRMFRARGGAWEIGGAREIECSSAVSMGRDYEEACVRSRHNTGNEQNQTQNQEDGNYIHVPASTPVSTSSQESSLGGDADGGYEVV